MKEEEFHKIKLKWTKICGNSKKTVKEYGGGFGHYGLHVETQCSGVETDDQAKAVSRRIFKVLREAIQEEIDTQRKAMRPKTQQWR